MSTHLSACGVCRLEGHCWAPVQERPGGDRLWSPCLSTPWAQLLRPQGLCSALGQWPRWLGPPVCPAAAPPVASGLVALLAACHHVGRDQVTGQPTAGAGHGLWPPAPGAASELPACGQCQWTQGSCLRGGSGQGTRPRLGPGAPPLGAAPALSLSWMPPPQCQALPGGRTPLIQDPAGCSAQCAGGAPGTKVSLAPAPGQGASPGAGHAGRGGGLPPLRSQLRRPPGGP